MPLSSTSWVSALINGMVEDLLLADLDATHELTLSGLRDNPRPADRTAKGNLALRPIETRRIEAQQLPSPSSDKCEFCQANLAEIQHRDGDVLVLRRSFGMVIAPRRHVARWRDLTGMTNKQHSQNGSPHCKTALLLKATPGSNLSKKAHICICGSCVPIAQHGPLPGLPHERPLISGGEDALHAHLLPYIDRAEQIDLAVSFLLLSGTRLILPHLHDMLERGGRLRLLTGDYLDVTEPEALRLLLDLEGARTLHAFQAQAIPFHPKAWMFSFKGGTGAVLVGSSNSVEIRADPRRGMEPTPV